MILAKRPRSDTANASEAKEPSSAPSVSLPVRVSVSVTNPQEKIGIKYTTQADEEQKKNNGGKMCHFDKIRLSHVLTCHSVVRQELRTRAQSHYPQKGMYGNLFYIDILNQDNPI